MKKFGSYVKELRIKKEVTLRQFCKMNEIDPSNWSKIERELLQPPKDENTLLKIAKSLNLDTNGQEYQHLVDLAAIAFIPKELISDEELLEKLPVFFRTVRGEQPSGKDLDELYKIIKDNYR